MTTNQKKRKKPEKRRRVRFPGIIVSGVIVLSFAVGCATTADDVPGPRVRVDGEEQVHVSPAASPGVNDYFAADVLASAGEEATLVEQEIVITDEEGVIVYLASAIGEMIPGTILWDGRDTLGNFVAQGRYVLSVTVMDDFGQSVESNSVEIVVDKTPPEADLSLLYNTFSPGGDERTVLPIRQRGSGAVTWSGSILDDDERGLVRHWDWDDADLPEEVEWDGRNSDGAQVEDGRYSYLLYGEDAAGNQTTVKQENIRVDTAAPAVSLSPNRRHFSPNESGVRDTVSFEARVPEELEVMEWTFSVLDEDGQTVMTKSSEDALQETLQFTGRSDGDALPEGAYRTRLEAVYINDERGDAVSRPVTLDVTPPTVSVSPAVDQFSPDGDEDHQRLGDYAGVQ